VLTTAISEGRRLFDNLRKAVCFYLGAKTGLVTLFVIGTLWNQFPLSPVQIILLELFMDIGASLSFITDPADADIMLREPRTIDTPFFDRPTVLPIMKGALSMVGCVIASFAYALTKLHNDQVQAACFAAWLMGHVLLAMNMRTLREPLIFKGLFRMLPSSCR
jgi:Ca2+-transporting ATPase